MSKSITMEVVEDAARADCFASVSHAFVTAFLEGEFLGRVPQVCALEVETSTGAKHYLGCLPFQTHRRSQRSLLLGVAFMAVLGLRAGETVQVRPLRATPIAANVVVEPASVDDSEIVERNPRLIENTLLSMLRVVKPGMKLSIPVHAGVRATLCVQEVRTQNGTMSPTSPGPCRCAILSQGTELYVAVKSRKAAQPEEELPPLPCVLRHRPIAERAREVEEEQQQEAVMLIDQVVVPEAVARRHRWVGGQTIVGVIPLEVAAAAVWEASNDPSDKKKKKEKEAEPESKPEWSIEGPSVLRQGFRCTIAVSSSKKLFPRCHGDDFVCYVPALGNSTATTVYLFPNPPAQVPLPKPQENASEASGPSLAELEAVHPEAIRELRNAIQVVSTEDDGLLPRNVLLCGGKGFGKTAIATAVASPASLPSFHSAVVDCASTAKKNVLPAVRKALLECLMCAPSVLILENIDIVAPAEIDGQPSQGPNAEATSLATLLSTFHFADIGFAHGPVVVVATAASREAVHESLRSSPAIISNIVKIAALTHERRVTLIEQFVNSNNNNSKKAAMPKAEAKHVARQMDNFTPHDVKQVCRRALQLADEADGEGEGKPGRRMEDHFKQVLESYRPLAHSGIKFFKGEKQQTLADIGGLEEVKKVLHNALILPSKFPNLFDKLPLKTRSGVLLYGPPGCGKTYVMSVLVAAENLNCIVVNGPEMLDKYIGASEQKVRDVFERAQAAAPCVVFFDEFDSIAPQRGHDNTGVTDRVVNQLLCYLDGVEARKNVFVVAASSRPDMIDAALLRPGRLDKAVYCSMPTQGERVEILQAHARKLDTIAPDFDFEGIARECEGWTSADLAALVSSANMIVMQRTIDMHQQLAALNVGGGGEAAAEGASGDAAASFHIVAPTAAKRRAAKVKLEDALGDILKGRLGPSLLQGDESSKRKELELTVTMADFRQAMQSARPSISHSDMARYEKMYTRFAAARAPKQSKSIAEKEAESPLVPGQRTSMA